MNNSSGVSSRVKASRAVARRFAALTRFSAPCGVAVIWRRRRQCTAGWARGDISWPSVFVPRAIERFDLRAPYPEPPAERPLTSAQQLLWESSGGAILVPEHRILYKLPVFCAGRQDAVKSWAIMPHEEAR